MKTAMLTLPSSLVQTAFIGEAVPIISVIQSTRIVITHLSNTVWKIKKTGLKSTPGAQRLSSMCLSLTAFAASEFSPPRCPSWVLQ
jgi:hypothetical protein